MRSWVAWARPSIGRRRTRAPSSATTRSPLVRPESINKRWNNHKNYADHGASLGKLLLLARRLCEAGCGFVTVTTNFVWDMHADQNNAPVEEGMGYCGRPLDHAVSAFIEDVEARGLSNTHLAGRLRRDGTHAALERQRGPRSLGHARAADALRRRPEHGPRDRPIDPRRRRSQQRCRCHSEPRGHDLADLARRRQAAHHARRAFGPGASHRRDADPGIGRISPEASLRWTPPGHDIRETILGRSCLPSWTTHARQARPA